jgi:hypothetical protein
MPRMEITISYPEMNDLPQKISVPKGDAARYMAHVIGSGLSSQGIVNNVENEHNTLEMIDTNPEVQGQ